MFKRIVIKSAGIPEFAADLQNYPTYDVEAMCTMGCFIVAVLREEPPVWSVVDNSVTYTPVSAPLIAPAVAKEIVRTSRKSR